MSRHGKKPSNWFERLLWVAAVSMLGFSIFMWFEGRIYQFYLNSQFEDALDAQQLAGAQHTPEALEAAAARARVAMQPYLGRLDIPRLDLSVMLLDGADYHTLLLGIGHIPGTALPGQPGNAGIAGHRDTFFRGLAGIRENDDITVKTFDGEFHYVVDAIRIVAPEDVSVLAHSDQPMLTLVTCYPFGIFGPAPNRFIVHASLKGRNPSALPMFPEDL
jgi:LPXTG-site transpeptidase (sortase) family protein